MSRPIEAVPESDQIDVERYVLRKAALDLSRSQRQTAEAVDMALTAGIAWNEISRVLGMSKEAAQTRFGQLARTA